MSHLYTILFYFTQVLIVYGMKSMDHLVYDDIKPGHQIVKEYHFHPYWHQGNAEEVRNVLLNSSLFSTDFHQRRQLPLLSVMLLSTRLLLVT